ncbi:O-methyltransferase [Nocardia tenerifensis]|uniref:O-methyltransferase n=1 Tax=Nocardia tenerifensis TaxID=228006 RepID=A0A318KH23_9NOCA|nr:methyltransferase [Nocardia tenerifensis]PXX71562.1 O-methyltransferase [Nocardia tenerifensis]
MNAPDPRDVARLRELIHGRWKSRALSAALRLGVIDGAVEGRHTIPELAGVCGVDAGALDRLVRLFIALNVLALDPAGHVVLAEGGRRLAPDHPHTAIRDADYTLSETVVAAWERLPHMVFGGDSPSSVAVAEQDAPKIAAYRQGVARKTMGALGLAEPDQVRVTADMTEIPCAAGRYLCLHALRDLPDDAARAFLDRVRQAMSPDCVLTVVAIDAAAARAALLPAYLVVQQRLLSAGRERTAAEYDLLLHDSGLRVTERTFVTGRSDILALTATTVRQPRVLSRGSR